MDKIAVLIPCLNEELTIEKVVCDFKKIVPQAVIYVYDNNSTDSTAVIAKKAGAIVRKESHRGKGNVIRRMFQDIDAECYIIVDGDDTYDITCANEMANLILDKKADMVVGDRLSANYATENKRLFHNWGNNLVKKLTNLIFKAKIKDVMSGFRAFSYQFVKSFQPTSNGFEIETEMTIYAIDKKMTVENYVINYRDRQEGSKSKLKTFSDGFRIIKTIIKLYRMCRPLSFYRWFFFLFGTIGTGFALSLLKSVSDFRIILSLTNYLVGLMFLIIGMIKQNLKKNESQ